MLNRRINCKCEIYSTQYKLTCHRDNTITVRSPYIKWVNNTGVLSFEHCKLSGSDADAAKKFFEADKLILSANNNGGLLSLDDVINGHRASGVMPFDE